MINGAEALHFCQWHTKYLSLTSKKTEITFFKIVYLPIFIKKYFNLSSVQVKDFVFALNLVQIALFLNLNYMRNFFNLRLCYRKIIIVYFHRMSVATVGWVVSHHHLSEKEFTFSKTILK